MKTFTAPSCETTHWNRGSAQLVRTSFYRLLSHFAVTVNMLQQTGRLKVTPQLLALSHNTFSGSLSFLSELGGRGWGGHQPGDAWGEDSQKGKRKGGAYIGATREAPLVHKSHQVVAVIKLGWMFLVWGFIILMLKEIIPVFFFSFFRSRQLRWWNWQS